MLLRLLAGLLCGCVAMLILRGYLDERARVSDATRALLASEERLLMEREELMSLVGRLEAEAAQRVAAGGGARAEALARELMQAQTLAGLVDMEGPGVQVVLRDAPEEEMRPGEDVNLYIVHDVDVLRVVSLLRNSGAECVSINGQRLLSNSRIRCGGPTIRVRDEPLTPPFVIAAIGDQQTMLSALTQRQGDGMSEMDILRFFGVGVEISAVEGLVVPRYGGELKYRYAKAVR